MSRNVFARRSSQRSFYAALAGALTIAQAGAASAVPLLDVSRTTVPFGRIALGVAFVQPVFLTNVGDAPLDLSGVSIAGPAAADFSVGGTCSVPSTLAPGAQCRVEITANAGAGSGSSRLASLTVQSNASPPAEVVSLSAIPVSDLSHGLYATPPWLDFGHQAIGSVAAPATITVVNPEASDLALVFDGVALSGGDAGDFSMTTDCVLGKGYSNNAGCSATVGFTPSTSGPRAAALAFRFHPSGASPGFVTMVYSVSGFGGAATPVGVVEYYNAALDHYFITWVAAEQANLDAGNTPTRWTRTGFTFRAYTAAQSATSPVCRYYLPPAFGDSHFFGRGTAECDGTGLAHPAFVLEDPQFMHMFLPAAGNCPGGTTPIYRVFSNRPDANHRYMTDRAVRDQMVARGWLAEGDGPDLVVMCAP